MDTRNDSASVDSLKNVDDAGSIVLDDLRNCPVFDQDTHLTDRSQPIDGIMKHLRETRSLDRELTPLRNATHPAIPAHRIEHLPEEILGIIFSFAITSWKDTFQISWVSRRFRSITLSTPVLWSDLPYPSMDEMNIELMKCLLERSKNVGLAVELPIMITEDYDANPEWDDAVGMLMKHSHRWKELSVDLAAVHSKEKLVIFPEAKFNAVERLYFGDHPRRYTWPKYGSDYNFFVDVSPKFYRSWSFPNLKSFTSEVHIPPAGVFPSLTELSLDLSLYEPPDEESHLEQQEQLFSFLQSVPTLEIFNFIAGASPHGKTPREVVTLPSLKTLHLENRGAYPEAVNSLRIVSSTLRTPAVETVSLFLDLDYKDDILGQIGGDLPWNWFPEHLAYNYLKRFKLENSQHNLAENMVLDVSRRRFPALEEIEIVTASFAKSLVVDATTTSQRIQFRETHLERNTAIGGYTFDNNGVDFYSDSVEDRDS